MAKKALPPQFAKKGKAAKGKDPDAAAELKRCMASGMSRAQCLKMVG